MVDPRDSLLPAAVLPPGWVLTERSEGATQSRVTFRRNRSAGPSITAVAATVDEAWLLGLARITALDAEAHERGWW